MDLTFLSDSPAIGASWYTDTCLSCDGIHGARMRFYFSADWDRMPYHPFQNANNAF